jgi:hypothetical protein
MLTLSVSHYGQPREISWNFRVAVPDYVNTPLHFYSHPESELYLRIPAIADSFPIFPETKGHRNKGHGYKAK